MFSYPENTLAVSLVPEEAVCYLAGIYKTLLVFEPPQCLKDYRGRILIHSLGFPDEPELKHMCQQILAEFGFDSDSFPSLAIQGLATIKDVFIYDAARFTTDQEAHGYTESLLQYQLDAEKLGVPTWGIELQDTYFLERPVCDVIPPSYVTNSCFWLPQGTEHLADFRAALQRDQLE